MSAHGEYLKSMPGNAGLNESELNIQAAELRNYFGDKLPGLIETLTLNGLENQRYKPLIDRIIRNG